MMDVESFSGVNQRKLARSIKLSSNPKQQSRRMRGAVAER